MAERATFCPRCGHMHIGICRAVIGGRVSLAGTEQNVPRVKTWTKAERPSPPIDPLERPHAIETVKAEVAAIEAGQPKRDRAAYMRDYRARQAIIEKKRK